MNPPKHPPIAFEMHEGYATFRASGQMSLDEAVATVDAALASARDQGIRNLLADVQGFTGFEPPSLGERYFFVRHWAATARGKVRVVIVTRPEMIDPQKFGVKVALNHGLTCEVFSTQAEAVAWLVGKQGK